MESLSVKYEPAQAVKITLVLSSAFCVSLLLFRIYLSGNLHYAFLIWNLFLAWIPLGLSALIIKSEKQNAPGLLQISFFIGWLLFFPNAPYILTDLFHLKQKVNVPLWYDLGLILSYAWCGLMLGFISLLEIQSFLDRNFKTGVSWALVITILFLCGFGIYLGRYERWNSWDVITNPVSLMMDIVDKLVHPLSHPKTLGVTLCFQFSLL